jgi:hypothetical protein
MRLLPGRVPNRLGRFCRAREADFSRTCGVTGLAGSQIGQAGFVDRAGQFCWLCADPSLFCSPNSKCNVPNDGFDARNIVLKLN